METRAQSGAQGAYGESDLENLRAEAMHLLALGILGLVVGILAWAAVDSRIRRPEIWLVVVPLLGAAFSTRVPRLGSRGGAALLIGSLGLGIIDATALYPAGHFLYALPLLAIVATALLGNVLTLVVAALASLVVVGLALDSARFATTDATTTVVFLIWSASALSWLVGRPTRSALDWAWRSYLLTLERTEELRERQSDLARLAKSLDETCEKLEEMNDALARARRAAEDARRLKAEFAAAVSHELRTPLNLIVGFCETMMHAPHAYDGQTLPPRYRDDLEIIHRNADHISRLIDDVLDLSQVEAHRMALDKDWTSLTQIARDAISTIGPLYKRLGLELALDAPTDFPPAFVDANRIRQILINLLSNAARFTSRGGVTIRLAVEKGYAVIAVRDTGAGIAPADLPHVFDEFRQVGPADQRTGGSGLGLAICKQFAEMHGGYMTVESTLGEGSTFVLALPLDPLVISSPFTREISLRRTDRRIIGILDREGETARVFQRYLDTFQVVAATSVAHLERLACEQPLCALIIPETSEAPDLQSVLRASSRLRDLPVFSCALSTPRQLAEELGVDHYLVKPVRREQLRAALRRTKKDIRDVLIVEDDPEMARLLDGFVRFSLPRRRVHHAPNGEEALHRLREVRPDVVLLDLLMPGLNGYDFIREIHSDPALRDLPVIVVSARGTHEEAIQSRAITLTRQGGLTVGEVVRCLESSLRALLDAPSTGTGQAPHAGSPG